MLLPSQLAGNPATLGLRHGPSGRAAAIPALQRPIADGRRLLRLPADDRNERYAVRAVAYRMLGS